MWRGVLVLGLALAAMPARGAAQTELRATFQVAERVEQPQLIASQGADASDGAVLSARVPAGWLASVDRRAAGTSGRVAAGTDLVTSVVAVNGSGDEATGASETWTFVPL